MSYAPINGLNMYYEAHGPEGGVPLVLLHGALSATETSFGTTLPELAKTRRVIAVEQQAHGRTGDIDRPLSTPQMAADTVALLGHLGIERADFFGYSMGSGIALHIGVNRPDVVRKLVLLTAEFNHTGMHEGLLEGVSEVTPEMLAGSPFESEYMRLAPNKDDWPALLRKVGDLNSRIPEHDYSEDVIRALQPPALLIIGDSDIVRPEHAVEFFRLLGGGVIGDMVGLPSSRLAILPGTTHVTSAYQAELLVPMINSFLDADSPRAA